MKFIYLFLFDGFSDWEIAFLTPEIAKSSQYQIKTFSLQGAPVRSMGNLQVVPDGSLKDIVMEDIAMLILPGGNDWFGTKLYEILPLVQKLYDIKKPIAAICGATLFLGQNKFLNNVKHTSNDKAFLKSIAPEYTGEDLYQTKGAYTDGNLITASGIAPIEFTREILHYLSVLDEKNLEKWYQLFKNGIWSY